MKDFKRMVVYHSKDGVHLFVKGWGFVRRFLGLFLRTIKGSNGPNGRVSPRRSVRGTSSTTLGS
jgi:hypothetical protein